MKTVSYRVDDDVDLDHLLDINQMRIFAQELKDSYSQSKDDDNDYSYSDDNDDDENIDKYTNCHVRYFDEIDASNDDDILNSNSYPNQKVALEYKNISNLIVNNAAHFDLTKEEAMEASIQLYNLLITPFSILNNGIPSAICPQSKLSHYWGMLKDFEYEKGRNFNILSKIAFRLKAISASEAGPERALSRLKWRFTDRRNKTSEKSMIREIYVENSYKQKNKDDNSVNDMWKLSDHLDK